MIFVHTFDKDFEKLTGPGFEFDQESVVDFVSKLLDCGVWGWPGGEDGWILIVTIFYTKSIFLYISEKFFKIIAVVTDSESIVVFKFQLFASIGQSVWI